MSRKTGVGMTRSNGVDVAIIISLFLIVVILAITQIGYAIVVF